MALSNSGVISNFAIERELARIVVDDGTNATADETERAVTTSEMMDFIFDVLCVVLSLAMIAMKTFNDRDVVVLLTAEMNNKSERTRHSSNILLYEACNVEEQDRQVH